MSAGDLREAWFLLWQRLGADGDAESAYHNLCSRYSQPGFYHNLTHVEHCLTELRNIAVPAANLDAIEFALWFHDAAYDTKAKDNEQRSAARAREVARCAALPDSFGDLVTDLILATTHTALPESPSEQVVVDIDLSILGQSPLTFDEYERQIRAEYSWAPADAFAKGRSVVLSSFLMRPRIYSTEFFFSRYEKAARENLARSISRLSRA